MDMHKNARLTPLGRERMVRLVLSGQTPQAVSAAVGVCPRTVRKWLERYEREGEAGLQDRSSRPHRLYRPTEPARVEQIEALRRQRWTGEAIAREVGVSAATVSRVLRRLGLNKLSALEPAQPVRRYERERPGELIHIDIRSSAASRPRATASPATARPAAPAAPAGTSCTSASMTPRAWPTPRSCPRKASTPPRPSWSVRSPGSAAMASPSSG